MSSSPQDRRAAREAAEEANRAAEVSRLRAEVERLTAELKRTKLRNEVAYPNCGICKGVGYVGGPPDNYEDCPGCIGKARVAELEHHLAECFHLSGADPDGDEDWRLAPRAVEEVKRLREEYDEACESEVAQAKRIAELEKERAALVEVARAADNMLVDHEFSETDPTRHCLDCGKCGYESALSALPASVLKEVEK